MRKNYVVSISRFQLKTDQTAHCSPFLLTESIANKYNAGSASGHLDKTTVQKHFTFAPLDKPPPCCTIAAGAKTRVTQPRRLWFKEQGIRALVKWITPYS